MMIGIVLAGGSGSRLWPVTRVVNKHLLPIYDKPMIFYPLMRLVQAGITRVIVVTSPQHLADFQTVLGDGSDLGLQRLDFALQQTPGGIAEALACARPLVPDDPNQKLCVMLGDNLYSQPIAPCARAFQAQNSGAMLLLKHVADPCSLGVATLNEQGELIHIEEKPDVPPSDLAVIGVYFYHASVFALCDTIKPSARGELEITDVNNALLQQGDTQWRELTGWWLDVGTFADMHRAAVLVAEGQR